MSVVLVTGWAGERHAKMAERTVPLMERYAKRHGYEFQAASLDIDDSAPPSWNKIPAIAYSLQKSLAVVWLDVDVVISDPSESIEAAVPADSIQGLVEHETECGLVPNCGVWVLRRAMLPVLGEIWVAREKYLHHAWWEQAAVIDRMGYSLSADAGNPHSEKVIETPLAQRTHLLPAKWNHHPRDIRRVPSPAFHHVTSYCDRLDVLGRLCDVAAT